MPVSIQQFQYDGVLASSRAPDHWGMKGAPATLGLVYAYAGGIAYPAGVRTLIADGTIALTDNATNYVEHDYSGVVSVNTTAFTVGREPMAVVTTLAGVITAFEDRRGKSGALPYYPTVAGEVGVTDIRYPYGDVRRHGASQTGTAAANATAINNAATSANAIGAVLTFPAGFTFATNGNLVILGPTMGKGAQLTWTGTGDAVAIAPTYSGVGGITFVQNETIHLPRVVNANKTVAGWAQAGVVGSVGVRVRHTYNCRVIVPFVNGFESGLLFYGEHDGTDYNNVQIGYLFNNKRNLVFDATSDGWANESNFFGGRLAHDPAEGTNVAGTRQMLILGSTTATDILNNHRFRGLSLEGDVAEYEVETKGSDCIWDHCRWESTGGAKFLSNGANAISNEVRGGFDAHLILFTTTGGAQQPRVETRDGLALAGAPAGAVLRMANQGSSASPMLRGYPAGTDLFGATLDTAWVWELTALGLKGKLTGDAVASPRILIDPTTGNITTLGKLLGGLSSLVPALDGSAFQSAIAAAATLSVPTISYALVLLVDSNSGHGAIVWVTGGTGAIIAGTDNGGVYTGVIGTASKINVAVVSGALKIENKTASALSMSGLIFKLA